MRYRVGLLAGVGVFLVKAAGIAIAGAVNPGYSHIAQAISELGARGTPSEWILRSTNGLTALLEAAFVSSLMSRRDTRVAGLVLLPIAVAALGGGLFPCSPGCPLPGDPSATTADQLHNLFGFVGGATLAVAPWVSQLQRSLPVSFRRSSLFIAALTSLAAVFALFGLSGHYKGLTQRAFQTGAYGWQAWLALTLLRRSY